MGLEDRVAIITGAGDIQGIGAAIAVRFAKEGARIVIADVRDGNDVVDSVRKAGSDAVFVKTDVTSQDECDAMAKAAMDRFGRIDILVNNAAKFRELSARSWIDITTEDWNGVMEVNTTGPFHCTKAVFPFMKEKGGKIINVSSSTIFEGTRGSPHYVSSKGAVFAFSRCMARELGPFNINVNTLAPGFTETGAGKAIQERVGVSIEKMMRPRRCLDRTASVEDLVGTAVFLAGDDSNFVTGQLILSDGGVSFN